jgi:hypothetical protein
VLSLTFIFQVTESNFTFKAQDYELEFDFFGSIDSALILQSLLHGNFVWKIYLSIDFPEFLSGKSILEGGRAGCSFRAPQEGVRRILGQAHKRLCVCARARARARIFCAIFGVRLRAFGAILRIKTCSRSSDTHVPCERQSLPDARDPVKIATVDASRQAHMHSHDPVKIAPLKIAQRAGTTMRRSHFHSALS